MTGNTLRSIPPLVLAWVLPLPGAYIYGEGTPE